MEEKIETRKSSKFAVELKLFLFLRPTIRLCNHFKLWWVQSHDILLSIAHGLIYSVLYYAAGTWLNEGLKEKYLKRLKVLSNSTLQIVFGKKKQEFSTLELHRLANMLTPEQMALYQPGCLLQKVLAVKAPGAGDIFENYIFEICFDISSNFFCSYLRKFYLFSGNYFHQTGN